MYFTLPVPVTVMPAWALATSRNAPQRARITFFHMTHRPFRPPLAGWGIRERMREMMPVVVSSVADAVRSRLLRLQLPDVDLAAVEGAGDDHVAALEFGGEARQGAAAELQVER